MLKTQLEDGWGSGKKARVDEEGQLNVIVHPHPPRLDSIPPLPLRQYMTLNGEGVVNDMRVDGSVNEQMFCISASPDYETYIAALSFVIADSGATLNQFGNIGELTNGIELAWITDEFGTEIIHESLNTNFEFVRLAGGQPAFGSGTSAFRASNVAGTSEAFLPYLDFDEIFGIKWGFKLRKASNDMICLKIRDDITGVDQFDCIAYGIRV